MKPNQRVWTLGAAFKNNQILSIPFDAKLELQRSKENSILMNLTSKEISKSNFLGPQGFLSSLKSLFRISPTSETDENVTDSFKDAKDTEIIKGDGENVNDGDFSASFKTELNVLSFKGDEDGFGYKIFNILKLRSFDFELKQKFANFFLS